MKHNIQLRLLGFTIRLCYRFFKRNSNFYRTKLWRWLWKQELIITARNYGGKVRFWDNGTWRA
jgi:hypothetical protein